MKQKARPPGPHPYDKAREDLKASGGGLFGVRINEPIHRGNSKQGLFQWIGSEIVAFEISAPRGMFEKYYSVDFRTVVTQSGWFVNIPAPQDAEELARLATVFMDLINTQRSGG